MDGLLNLFLENWSVLVPLIAGLVIAFFPQLKPFVDIFVKAFGKKKDAVDGDEPAKPCTLLEAVEAIKAAIDHFRATGNLEGEELARKSAQALFDVPKKAE